MNIQEWLDLIGGRMVYHEVVEKREDGYTWLGGYFDEYDRHGNFVRRHERQWTGFFVWN